MNISKWKGITVIIVVFFVSVVSKVYIRYTDRPTVMVRELRANQTEDIGSSIRSRAELVRETCERCGRSCSFGGVDKAPLHQLRWLVKRKMIICFTPKVGTSTWLQYLMRDGFPGQLEGSPNHHETAARLLRPPDSSNKTETFRLLQQFGKVLPVRHPFARLVSAYVDKIATCMKRECNISRQENGLTNQHPTFEDFARFLVRTIPAHLEPFADKGFGIDRHWRPYYLLCSPCDVDYDYVVTMETWEQDTRFILNQFSIPENGLLHLNYKNSTTRAIEYFKRLPRPLVAALYERYKHDFEMFGYTPHGYMS